MQAVGAGKVTRLPILCQRTALFLIVHCIPISAVMLGVPHLLNLTGQDTELSQMVFNFMLYVIPGVFLEALSRPLSRILVANRVAAPLMVSNERVKVSLPCLSMQD